MPANNHSHFFLDKLTLFSMMACFRQRKNTRELDVINYSKYSFAIYKTVAKSFGVKLNKLNFFAGELNTKSGENIVFFANKRANELSYQVAHDVCKKHKLINDLNDRYDRNHIKRFIVKNIHSLLMPTMLQLALVDALNVKNPTIFVKRSLLASSLKNNFRELNIRVIQYDDMLRDNFDLGVTFVLSFARIWKRLFINGIFSRKYLNLMQDVNLEIPAVFLLQEDTVRFDDTLRNQPHWAARTPGAANFNTLILQLNEDLKVQKEDVTELARCNIFPLSMGIFRKIKNKKGSITHKMILSDFLSLIKCLIFREEITTKTILINLAFFMLEVKAIYSTFEFLNVKTFVFSDSYHSFADACLVSSCLLGAKSIGYQYSNLPVNTPLTTTACDVFITFSEMFEDNFKANGIAPNLILPFGYVNLGLEEEISKRASMTRAFLRKNGAEKTIVYFDESVIEGKWSIINKSEHLKNLHILFDFVLENSSFGLIIKPKFAFNSPSALYPKDTKLQKLKSTGRYREDVQGGHRNDTYPLKAL